MNSGLGSLLRAVERQDPLRVAAAAAGALLLLVGLAYLLAAVTGGTNKKEVAALLGMLVVGATGLLYAWRPPRPDS